MSRCPANLLVAALSGVLPTAAPAQTPEINLDQLIVATRPTLSAGKITGTVVAAHTADCKTTLTLDDGMTYAFDLTKTAVSMNKELMIGDGDDVIGLTYFGDSTRRCESCRVWNRAGRGAV